MANEEHLEILKKGAKAWNSWRECCRDIKPDLSRVNLEKAGLRETDLNQVDLRGANLSQAILQGANLRRANLSSASLSERNPTDIEITENNFVFIFLKDSSIDRPVAYFRKTNLSGSNLSGANLEEANLNEANLCRADLSQADLSRISALHTNFSQAIFTGVCIEDWHINRFTKLDDVICDYVYLKRGQQERRPHMGSFVRGDFLKLVQDSLDTVDLIFNEGVNWKAFAYSFHNTQVENEGIPLAIRSIENKGDGVVLIRVTVLPDTDKGKIYNDFLQGYEFAEKALEPKYQARLEDKDKEINRLFYLVNQLQNQLGEVPKLMAEQSKYDQRGANISIGSYVDTAQSGSRQQGQAIQHNYAPEQKQTLAEAAAEIQQLLQQLEQTNPSATEAEKIEHINDETTPKFKKRVVGALQATGEAAIDEFVLENKYLKVAKAAIKGWMKPE
ncbi:pentapeptide repeat-containing protein [Microcoleus sp. FACHB-53]|nr:pentapeptide repeat-containing protein [Microcoleus sp. FACHB-53]